MRVSDLRISRRSLLAFAALGLFILFDLALFGWLIFRSLSQREIQRVLLDTREQVEGLAEQIADRAEIDERDLYSAVASEQETLSYIEDILQQRDVVHKLEIRDRDDMLVYRTYTVTTIPVEPGAELGTFQDGEMPRQLETTSTTKTHEFELERSPFDIEVPIGELGFVHVGISQGQMQQRIEVLRRDLMGQVSVVGAVTLTVLLAAYMAVWWLYKRGRRLEEQAAEAERLAYIGTLASGLAHEIRNPLNSLRLNMQMLEEDLGRGTLGTDRKILSITQSEIARLERLATDFLTYARPRALELAPVPAVELLQSAREALSGTIAADSVSVSVEDRTGGAQVSVDSSLMQQLLLNLLQNALAAVSSGERGGEVRLVARRRGDAVVLEVVDDGPGIPGAEQAKIFDLFYSTRKGGTGLGLAIVKRIAQAHGADLTVSSSPGEGTIVSIALPSANEPETREVAGQMVESRAST